MNFNYGENPRTGSFRAKEGGFKTPEMPNAAVDARATPRARVCVDARATPLSKQRSVRSVRNCISVTVILEHKNIVNDEFDY